MFEALVELVMTIWRKDTELRNGSLVGETELDRKSRKWVGWICGGLIVLLVIAGVLWFLLEGGF